MSTEAIKEKSLRLWVWSSDSLPGLSYFFDLVWSTCGGKYS